MKFVPILAFLLLIGVVFSTAPSAPGILSPTIGSTGVVNITYTASESPDGYAISHYNISLYNSDGTFNKTIVANNSVNLSYQWNSSSTPFGAYDIRVTAYDNLSQTSFARTDVLNFGNGTLTTSQTLISNIQVDGKTSFTIGAANVTLDCAGYSITGNNSSSTYGIYSDQFNTTIRNCNISNFATAINYSAATDGLIQNNTITTTINGGSINWNSTCTWTCFSATVCSMVGTGC